MKERYRNTLIDYAYITIGSAITALSIAMFTNPAQIAPGGVSGIGTLLYHTLGIDVGLSILVLSLPIFLIGVKLFGKMYGLKSLIGTLLLSLFTSMWNIMFGYGGILDYSKDMSLWLSCLYGGVLSGFGMGLVMKGGSNTGGTDIRADHRQVHQDNHRHMPDDRRCADHRRIRLHLQHRERAVRHSGGLHHVMGAGQGRPVHGNGIRQDDIHHQRPSGVIPNQSISRLVRKVHELDQRAFLIIQDTHHVLGEGFTPIGRMVAEQKNDVTQE